MFLAVTTRELLPASSGEEQGMVLNILDAQDNPHSKELSGPDVNGAEIETHCLSISNGSVIFFWCVLHNWRIVISNFGNRAYSMSFRVRH